MKILIVTYFYPPLNSVASLRPFSFAKAYADLGHEVTVLTAKKPSNSRDIAHFHPKVQVIEAESWLLLKLYGLLRINADKRSQDTPSKSSLAQRLNKFRTRRGLLMLGRLPDLLDLLSRPSKQAIANEHYDLVISSYAPRYCHNVANHLKLTGRAKIWVADFRDLWTLHHQFKGVYPITLLEERYEKTYLKNADLVTTVSDALAQELKGLNSSSEVIVVPNGYDPADIHQISSAPIVGNEKIRLVYTGTTYPRWGSFKKFLLALQLLNQAQPQSRDKLQVIFAGVDVAGLALRASELGISELCQFVGMQSRDDALRLQRDAQVQLFFDPNKGNGIATGKIYEYISSGTPIWRIGPPNQTFALDLLSKTNTGTDIGDNPEQIFRRLERLVDGQSVPRLEPNLAEIQRYDRNVVARDLLDKVIDILNPKQS